MSSASPIAEQLQARGVGNAEEHAGEEYAIRNEIHEGWKTSSRHWQIAYEDNPMHNSQQMMVHIYPQPNVHV